MTLPQRRGGVIAACAALVFLTSCAEVAPQETPTEPPVIETPAPEALKPPVSGFSLTCDELVSPETVGAIWAEELRSEAIAGVHLTPSGLIGSAILHDGALSCRWFTGDDPLAARLTIIALPESNAAWETISDTLLAPPYDWTPASVGDSSAVSCDDSNSVAGLECLWNATQDDVWVFVGARNLPATEATIPVPRDNPDTSRKPLIPTIEGSTIAAIVAESLDNLVAADRRVVPRPATAAPDCGELFSSESGVEFLAGRQLRGGRVELTTDSVGRTSQSQGGAMVFASAQRLGYTECLLPESTTEIPVHVVVAPEAEWAIGYPSLYPAAGYETVDRAMVMCAEYSCVAYAVVEGTVMASETSMGEYTEEIARDAAVRAVLAMVDSVT